ncbi:MAG TPA: lytic transglycosylase domain-containing protein [Streptosporangiaceae bacterium]|nr:lytic transglycosylase domain-containing protein [Streptosporangiaceae bacterium]
MTIAAGGLAVLAAGSTAMATVWPSGAPVGLASAADYLPGTGHVLKTTGGLAFDRQLSASKAQVAWQARLREWAQAERAAAAAAAKKAAAKRAAALAAQRQAASQQAPAPAPAPAPPPVVVSSGSAQQIAMSMLASFGWSSSQFSCLDPLWSQESGWSVTAANPDGAYGIPQALPGSKMASAGPNWQTDAATQIRWGLQYIRGSYGSPCAAWAHEQSTGWY